MKKEQLDKIIREETAPSIAWRIQQRLNEIDFYDETQAGQLLGTETGDLRFDLEVQVESDVKSAIVQAVKAGLDAQTAVEAVLRVADKYAKF